MTHMLKVQSDGLSLTYINGPYLDASLWADIFKCILTVITHHSVELKQTHMEGQETTVFYLWGTFQFYVNVMYKYMHRCLIYAIH